MSAARVGGQRPFVVEQFDQRKDRRFDLNVLVVYIRKFTPRLVELGNSGPVQALYGIGFHASCRRDGLRPGCPAGRPSSLSRFLRIRPPALKNSGSLACFSGKSSKSLMRSMLGTKGNGR